MTIWDPHYEALMNAKAAVCTATLFVDAATTARPFDMGLLNRRLDELNMATRTLEQAHQNQENAA